MQEQDKQISFVDKWLCHLTSAHVTGHTITYAYLDSHPLRNWNSAADTRATVANPIGVFADPRPAYYTVVLKLLHKHDVSS
jgi:hypothetical protein